MARQTSAIAKEVGGTQNTTRAKNMKQRLDGVVFEDNVPPPPPGSNLSKEQTEIYHQIGQRIAASMPMMQIDSYNLALLATWVSIANDAKRYLDQKGAIQIYEKTKARAVSPELLLFEKASVNITKIGAGFGLNPKDRLLLLGTFSPKPEAKDPLKDL